MNILRIIPSEKMYNIKLGKNGPIVDKSTIDIIRKNRFIVEKILKTIIENSNRINKKEDIENIIKSIIFRDRYVDLINNKKFIEEFSMLIYFSLEIIKKYLKDIRLLNVLVERMIDIAEGTPPREKIGNIFTIEIIEDPRLIYYINNRTAVIFAIGKHNRNGKVEIIRQL
ncbi:MAG: hypothetical protein ACP5GJ_04265 [Nanopusillaceae archaeon]